MASENTAGTYKCLVSDRVSGLRKSSSFSLEVLTLLMGPRCWSSVALQNGVATGQEFYADCFYSDKNDAFDSKWTKVSPNGTETSVASTEMILPGKKKRTLKMTAVEDEDDGVLYKCSVSHKSPTMFIQFTPCEIGPVYVYEESTVRASVTSLFTSPFLSTTRILPDIGTLGTTKQFSDTSPVVLSDPSLFDGHGLYIIVAIAVAFLIFILIPIVICLYCHKHSKGGESPKAWTDEENDLSKPSTTELVNPANFYNTLPVDKDGSYYDTPPSGVTEDKKAIERAPISSATNRSLEYVNAGLTLDKESNRGSFILLGPEDLVSTHL
ncbi:hypothetical protein HOLleu_27430 [Holothuria leucospilota]|uniref:Ig-like domain-containing protein n=1 Tax=Holothuria leucospilota TaxID=206669 RepID=A0A9Q1BQT6_HOLLE|nr:hypothetical protein HOLleu_27430 [Holothuria leucospilota]